MSGKREDPEPGRSLAVEVENERHKIQVWGVVRGCLEQTGQGSPETMEKEDFSGVAMGSAVAFEDGVRCGWGAGAGDAWGPCWEPVCTFIPFLEW